MINENVSFNASIMVKNNDNVDVSVAYMSATLDNSSQNFVINFSTINKELAAAHADEVKAQYAAFETTVKNRAIGLGYLVF